MTKKHRIVSFLLAASVITSSFVGCSGSTDSGVNSEDNSSAQTSATDDPDAEYETSMDWSNMANTSDIPEEYELGTGEKYVQGQKAGTVKALCYYDLAETQPDLAELLATRYGGVIETEVCKSGTEYFEQLAKLIASGESPDIVRYDSMAYPWGVAQNLYTPLDGWLDIDSPLWSGEKEVIDSFMYGGKHYYFPSDVEVGFAMIYDRKNIDEYGLDDPAELYREGNWTWSTFEEICSEWANKNDEHVAFTGGSWSSLMFINTTGTSLVDVQEADIVNNMKNENVQRTMDWISTLKSKGLIGDGFIDPAQAFIDGKLLFLGMGLTWGFESAQQTAFKQGIDAEYVALPFPRDEQADEYYMASGSFGFMIPAGAKNVQGGVDWILCGRVYETDPEIVEEWREEKMYDGPYFFPKCPECKYDCTQNENEIYLEKCPKCGTARKPKFKAVYTEEQMDIIADMKNPDKLKLVFDGVQGFSSDFSSIFVGNEETVLDGPLYYGTSYTQVRDANYGLVESYLEPFRQSFKDAANRN